jgi:hypothetical protein
VGKWAENGGRRTENREQKSESGKGVPAGSNFEVGTAGKAEVGLYLATS